MRIVIFGGTTEGREIAARAAALGAEVLVSVATGYGAEMQGNIPGVQVRVGRLEPPAMAAMLTGCALCVDATHPYAVVASRSIQTACRMAGVPCRRLLREETEPVPGAEYVSTDREAAALLADRPGRILLTTGAKELPVFAPLGPERLVARVLPSHESLSACEMAGLPHKNIAAMQGPFSMEMNRALLRQYHIRWMVTKDGGAPGGFAEKAQAARECGVGLVVIARPQEQGDNDARVLALIEHMQKEQYNG